MSSIAKIYAEAVHHNFSPLFANWEPGQSIELGDYGIMSGRIFIQQGNIRELGIETKTRSDTTKDQKFFASEGSTEVKFHAKGATVINGSANSKALLEVSFSGREGVFFNAADCSYTSIADKVQLGRELKKREKAKEWKREWAVVTDLLNAGRTTIAVSGAKSAAIVFEAEGNVDRIELANAGIGFSLRSSSNIGFQVVATEGLTPLFGLCKFQKSFPGFWKDSKFRPFAAAGMDMHALEALRGSLKVQEEEAEDEVYFGQLL